MNPITFNLRISDGSWAFQRALRIAAARQGLSVRDFVLCTMYDALNRELVDLSVLWERTSYQDLRERRQANRERRSAAARKAVMARWHPELRKRKPEAVVGVEHTNGAQPRRKIYLLDDPI